MLTKQISFDEMPCIGASVDELDNNVLLETLKPLYKRIDKKNYQSLGLTTQHHKKVYPTHGAILLFSEHRFKWFPDSMIRCVCFAGETRERIIDQKEISSHLIAAVDDVIAFINRHTNMAAKIGATTREDIPQFPAEAVREIVINAIVHADYALRGSSIQIAIFSNRIEFTNPGGLPFGQTIESATSGISKMRNRVIGSIFRELKLIERLGSGLPRVIAIYKNETAIMPLFEEINHHFRVTLFEATSHVKSTEQWELSLLQALSAGKSLGTKQIAALWNTTDRTARTRLKVMTERGLVKRNAKSMNDPKATYTLR